MDQNKGSTVEEASDAKPKRNTKPPQLEFPQPSAGAAKRSASAPGRSGIKKGKRQSRPKQTDAIFAADPGNSMGGDSAGERDCDDVGEYSQDENTPLDPEGEALAGPENHFEEFPQTTQHKPVSLIASDRLSDYTTTRNADTFIPQFDLNPIGQEFDGGSLGRITHSGANTNAHASDQPESTTDLPLATRTSGRVPKQTQHFVKEHSRNYEQGIKGRHQMSQGAAIKRDRDNESIEDNEDDGEGIDDTSEHGSACREPENYFPPGQNQSHAPNVFTLVYIPRAVAGVLAPTYIPGRG